MSPSQKPAAGRARSNQLQAQAEPQGSALPAEYQSRCQHHVPIWQQATAPAGAGETGAIITDPGRSEECELQLQLLLKKRDLPGARVLEQIHHLAENIGEGGELFNIDAAVRGELLYWAARLHLQHGIGGDRGEAWMAQLRRLDPAHPGLPLLSAWLSYYQGEPLKALEKLQGLQHPDVMDSILTIQAQEGSHRQAVDWYLASPKTARRGLSAHGWHLLAQAMGHCDLWDQAADVLKDLQETDYEACPALLYTEGLVNIALMLPPLTRRRLLYGHTCGIHGVLEPRELKNPFHQRAGWALARAEEKLHQCEADEYADNALRMRAWLLLLDPQTFAEGEKIVQEAMHDTERSARYIELAAEFGIMVYGKVLDRALNRSSLMRGMDPDYLASRYFFLKYSGSRHRLLTLLQDEGEKLKRKVFDENTWADLFINLLISCGQYDIAEAVVYENRNNLPWHFVPLRRLIGNLRNGINRPFEQVCEGDDLDALATLCRERRYHAPEALYPFILELAYKAPSENIILLAAHCLEAMQRSRDLLELLEQWDIHLGQLSDNDELLACRARTLMNQGLLDQAAEVLERISDKSVAGTLPLTLAFLGGHWQTLPALLQQTLEHLQHPAARDSLLLASMALDNRRDLALGLLLGADKQAPKDVRIQSAIYRLIRHSGNHALAAAQLGKALQSRGALAPCWNYGYGELVDVLSLSREWTVTLEAYVIQGRMPLAVACEIQGLPLAETLLSRALHNESLRDRRHMKLLPVHFANKGGEDIGRTHTLAMEMGALMLAESLDLFPQLLERFAEITIPHSTQAMLYREMQQLRQEQDTRIDTTRAMLVPIEQGVFRVELPLAVKLSSWIRDEVGEERAELLELARLCGGKVVLPNPLYKSYAMSCELAELGPYKDMVISVRQYLDWSARSLRQQIPDGALEILNDLEEGIQGAAINLDGPVFMDEQALERIHHCDLLQLLSNEHQPLFLHPAAARRLHETATLQQYRQQTLDILSSLQQRLAGLMHSQRIRLTPMHPATGLPGSHGTAIMELLDTDTRADVYWIEDRCLGDSKPRHPAERRHKSRVGVLDIINELRHSGCLQGNAAFDLISRLRAMGCYLLPVDSEELRHWLFACPIENGQLQENDGLRRIRHYLQRLISSHWIQVPAESWFLERLHLSVIQLIRDMWLDETMAETETAARASWLVENIFPNLAKWRHALEEGMNLYFFEDATAMYLAAFLALQPGDGRRAAAFREWLNGFLLSDFRLRNWAVIHKTIEFHKKQLLGLAGIEYDTDDHDHHH